VSFADFIVNRGYLLIDAVDVKRLSDAPFFNGTIADSPMLTVYRKTILTAKMLRSLIRRGSYLGQRTPSSVEVNYAKSGVTTRCSFQQPELGCKRPGQFDEKSFGVAGFRVGQFKS